MAVGERIEQITSQFRPVSGLNRGVFDFGAPRFLSLAVTSRKHFCIRGGILFMSSSNFGFFTTGGEARAQELVTGICIDVVADRITRRQALDRTACALDRVGESDDGISEPDTFDAVAADLSTSFANAGFLAISGPELRRHYFDWGRRGAAITAMVNCPVDISAALRAAKAATDALAALCARSSLQVAVSPCAPWDLEYVGGDSEAVVFTWTGESSTATYVGFVLNADDACRHDIETLAGMRDLSGHIARVVFPRDEMDHVGLAAELGCVASTLRSLNLAVQRINEPDRLGLQLTGSRGLLSITATWDGDIANADGIWEHPPRETAIASASGGDAMDSAISVDEALGAVARSAFA